MSNYPVLKLSWTISRSMETFSFIITISWRNLCWSFRFFKSGADLEIPWFETISGGQFYSSLFNFLELFYSWIHELFGKSRSMPFSGFSQLTVWRIISFIHSFDPMQPFGAPSSNPTITLLYFVFSQHKWMTNLYFQLSNGERMYVKQTKEFSIQKFFSWNC